MHQRRSRPFARGSSSFSHTKVRNDETFVVDDKRHRGVQDIGKNNSDKSVEPRALQGRRKEQRKHSLRRPPWIEKNFRLNVHVALKQNPFKSIRICRTSKPLRVSKLIPEMQLLPQENLIAIHVWVTRFRVMKTLKIRLHTSTNCQPWTFTHPTKPNGKPIGFLQERDRGKHPPPTTTIVVVCVTHHPPSPTVVCVTHHSPLLTIVRVTHHLPSLAVVHVTHHPPSPAVVCVTHHLPLPTTVANLHRLPSTWMMSWTSISFSSTFTSFLSTSTSIDSSSSQAISPPPFLERPCFYFVNLGGGGRGQREGKG